jgi:outer membrane protein assembly factor BamB
VPTRTGRRLPAAAAVLVGLVAVAACGSAKRADAPPQNGGGPGWLAPNGDLSNTRRVNGPIDAASVSRLRFAWRRDMNAVATPLVSRGIVYTQDVNGTAFAVELAHGRALWTRRFSAAEGATQTGPNGLALGDGRVYGSTTTVVYALDQKTGRLVWRRRIVRGREGIDVAPAYADGTLYVSTNPGPSGYGSGVRGVVWALDGASGRPRWSWATTEPGLWGHPELNGGGGLWYTPGLDGRGGIYLGTGNPGPIPGARGHPWGASRPGANRWTDSLVKLDARTGRFLWARQVLAHDIYDWDFEAPVVLVRAGGRALAIGAGKMGWVYAFDRDSGALVWKRSVGVHNGHDRDNLRALRGTDRSRAPRRVLPGVFGGVETPMAADRTTLYVPVVNHGTIYGPEAISGAFGPNDGEIVAIDLASGTVRWDRRLPSPAYGAATVVNDLVLTTTEDGSIWALRKTTGAIVWHARLPDGTNGPLAVAGDTLLVFPNIPFGNDQPIAMWAYRLRGG